MFHDLACLLFVSNCIDTGSIYSSQSSIEAPVLWGRGSLPNDPTATRLGSEHLEAGRFGQLDLLLSRF